MAQRVTLAQVAQCAGVSPASASLALNNKKGARIAEETVARVQECARRLGYSPDPTARSLRTGKTQTLGFLSDEVITTRFASAMIHGILDTAEDYGHFVLMAESEHDGARWNKSLENMLARKVDAYIFGFMQARELDTVPALANKPLVIVNGRCQGVPSVLPDEYVAGAAAIQYLLDRGHRNIAFVGRPEDYSASVSTMNMPRRIAGIDAVMQRAGLRFADEYLSVNWEQETGYQGAEAILRRTPGITAFLAANDRIAFGIYRVLRERGLSVPQDVSVMSFDDEELASYIYPGLTTVRLPYQEMGQVAVQVALEKNLTELKLTMREDKNEILLPMPLIERDSVGVVR